MTDGFHRYLRAKRPVDDRSLDGRLVSELREGLADREGPLRVLEVGAGVGTMVARFLEWDVLPPGEIAYTAVDVDETTVAAIPDHLDGWAGDRDVAATRTDEGVELAGPDRTVRVEPVAGEATTFVAGAEREWDLLVGAALLDLVGLDGLPALLAALAPGGHWYFPITFDGATRFLPAHPADGTVERLYHRHMDRKPGGDSRAGTHALDRLLSTDSATVDGVAGSDWAVRPVGDSYPGDEAFLVAHVLDTIGTALQELDRGDELDGATLADWLSTRRAQLDAGELAYLTHQLDLLGRHTPG